NPYEDSFEEHFDETYTIDLIRTIFGRSPPYRLLDCGSANGLTLQRFARKNVEAWGIEYSPYIYARTPEPWRARNIYGDVRKLPFDDGFFDFVYETCLCYLPEADLDTAISELFRVCRAPRSCSAHGRSRLTPITAISPGIPTWRACGTAFMSSRRCRRRVRIVALSPRADPSPRTRSWYRRSEGWPVD